MKHNINRRKGSEDIGKWGAKSVGKEKKDHLEKKIRNMKFDKRQTAK